MTTNLCNLCNRKCNVDRDSGTLGFCGVTNTVRVARAALHMWEEPCISGDEGSGAVFFSGCSLKCVFCQNIGISRGVTGKDISTEKLADLFIKLQRQNANNINLVTPGHYVYQVKRALDIAKEMGLDIPIVYNTGSYETEETIIEMNGYINVYLPDLKYYDDSLAIKYSAAPGYNIVAMKAITRMLDQVGEPCFDDRGIMTGGVIVRHLILPGHIEDSKKVIKQLYSNFGDSIYISIMSQYTPMANVKDYDNLSRKVTDEEYDEVVDYAIDIGVENGFIQEGATADDSFIPEFDLTGLEDC